MPEERLTKKELRAFKKQQQRESSQLEKRNQGLKKAIIWIVVVAVVIVVISLMASNDDKPVAGTDEITKTDHIKGSATAGVTLLEYSDFQCPACAFYKPMVAQLTAEYGDQIAFIYRHFPLRQIHPNADEAAYAAEAAGYQSKFWEMHDLLFDEQNLWSKESNPTDIFITYAERLQLDMEQFRNDYNSSKVKEKVDADLYSGRRAGVNGTPTFFLNGEKFDNPRSYQDLKQLIDGALSRQ
ncbi:MAG: DsbA family protein [Candidatus Komeilibacteria bacterium]|nr:DsbA family protein [Candidatus Komeilibacteria bacterium]